MQTVELNNVVRPSSGYLMSQHSTSLSETPNHDGKDLSVRRLEIELAPETALELNDEAAAILARIIRAHLHRHQQRRSGAAYVRSGSENVGVNLAFAAYVRTSTEDNQSPEDSKRWQLALAEQLIAPQGGSIVSVYHDIDVSRSLPWSRRPAASQLLEDAKSKSRQWSRLVIGEPQRAFSGPQFQLVLPVLTHFGIELWVPELGGPVDPDSEAHDLVMNLFGGLSKAERQPLR